MKLSALVKKCKTLLSVFRKEPEPKKTGKKTWIAWVLGILAALVLVAVGGVILIKTMKKRRLEKEAQEALEEHISTDPDADEYAEDEPLEDEETEE